MDLGLLLLKSCQVQFLKAKGIESSRASPKVQFLRNIFLSSLGKNGHNKWSLKCTYLTQIIYIPKC